VYVPFTRYVSTKAMERGDAYWARAAQLKTDTSASFKDVEELNVRVNKIYRLVETYFEWSRNNPEDPYDPNSRLNRTLVHGLQDLEKDIREIDDFVLNMTKDDQLDQPGQFQFLFDRLRNRAANIEIRLNSTVGKPLVLQTHTEEYYSGLYYAALPDLLTTVKKIHDLYIVEQCFDRAMTEYVTAIGYSRLWARPRRRMGDLYRERGWPEFAMSEYLRALKLDLDGEEGQLAFDQLQKYEGQNVEADFHIGLAHLLKKNNEAGLKYLRRFVERYPGDVLAPKASQVIKFLEAGEQIYIDQYLRNEIWI
ncbi:MAG: hypothetical protein AAB229_03030, partial [Candidatus Hydrogenedentota bacterium]